MHRWIPSDRSNLVRDSHAIPRHVAPSACSFTLFLCARRPAHIASPHAAAAVATQDVTSRWSDLRRIALEAQRKVRKETLSESAEQEMVEKLRREAEDEAREAAGSGSKDGRDKKGGARRGRKTRTVCSRRDRQNRFSQRTQRTFANNKRDNHSDRNNQNDERHASNLLHRKYGTVQLPRDGSPPKRPRTTDVHNILLIYGMGSPGASPSRPIVWGFSLILVPCTRSQECRALCEGQGEPNTFM